MTECQACRCRHGRKANGQKQQRDNCRTPTHQQFSPVACDKQCQQSPLESLHSSRYIRSAFMATSPPLFMLLLSEVAEAVGHYKEQGQQGVVHVICMVFRCIGFSCTVSVTRYPNEEHLRMAAALCKRATVRSQPSAQHTSQ